jgi:hypothetical protein
MMKTILFFLISILAVSCFNMKENSYYLQTTGHVTITQVVVPDTTINMESTVIRARAEESNGCWSNLHFILTKNSDFEYSLEAYGLFVSYGSCPDVVVFKDSIIPFKPEKTGLYRFTIFVAPDQTKIDTMIVVGDN